MKKITRFLSSGVTLAAILSTAVLMCGSASALTIPSSMVAQTAQQQVCAGIGLAGGNCGASSGASEVNKVLALVINLISLIVGIAAVVMIILAGMKFITSGGDPSKVSSAKNQVIYALVGLIVVAFSQLLVHLVINKA